MLKQASGAKPWVEHKPMSGPNVLKRVKLKLRTMNIHDNLQHKKMKTTSKKFGK